MGSLWRRVTFRLTILAGLLAASGCKTSADEPSATAPLLDGETDLKAPPPEQADTSRVPMSMWSPAQRRSTASYYYMVAEYVAMKERDSKKALSLLETAYGLDPNPFLGGKMLAAKAAAGERAEALLEAKKMVLLYPRDAQLRFFYGDMLVQSGQADEAATQLEKCLELDPHYEHAYLLLTEVYNSSKQPQKALVVAKDLVKAMPGSVAGWSQLSRLYLTSARYKEAVIPARRAWEMQSSNPQLAQIYAVTLALSGKPKQAVRIYEQLYRLDPTDDETIGRMIDLYRELGDPARALELLDEMAKEGGQAKPAVEMQKAILLWELKRNAEATALLDRLVKEYPESDRVRFLAAFGHERMEQPDRALELYRAVPKDSSLRRDAEIRSLQILKEKKRPEEAVLLAEELEKAELPTWEAYPVIAGAYADAKRYDDAIRVVESAFKRFPDKPRLLFFKGVFQEKAGDRSGCIATMRQVIKLEPENSSAYNYLGYLFAERGENLDEAENLVKKALNLKPKDGFYLDSLGWVYFQKGEREKAQKTLEDALQREPKEGVIMEHLGDVHKAKGDKAKAHELYEQALKTNLEDADRQRIEKKVKEAA